MQWPNLRDKVIGGATCLWRDKTRTMRKTSTRSQVCDQKLVCMTIVNEYNFFLNYYHHNT